MTPSPCGCSESRTLAAGAGAAAVAAPPAETGTDIQDCVACGVQAFERNSYFDGKLMLARDFEAEQAYVRRKDHLHNQLLHGVGTVCGLRVTEHPNAACRDRYVRVEPGVALDCCGREIVVAEEQFVPLRDLVDASADEDAVWPADVALCVSYRQLGVEEVPALFADCGCDDDGTEPNRIRETYAFDVRIGPPPAAQVVAPVSTQIDWRTTLQVERPAAVLPDRELQTLYVVAGDTDEGRLDLYDADNHSFQGTVAIAGLFDQEGDVRTPAAAVALSQFGDRLFVAAVHQAGEADPAPAIRAYAVDTLGGDSPASADLALDGAVVQLLVSPVSGALFALDAKGGRVLVWEIPSDPSQALPDTPTTTIEVGSGLRHMALSHDGRHLFLARDLDAGTVEVRALSDLATAHPFDVGATPRRIALSFDDQYLYVLADAASDDPDHPGSTPTLRRFDAHDPLASLPVEGQVARFDVGTEAVDLAIAPGDRWAYLYLRDTVDAEAEPGQRLRRNDEALVVPYRLERLDGVTPERVREGFATPVDVGTTPLFSVITYRGERLYAASGDPASPPDDQVAVLSIVESPCDAIFEGAVDGCPSCEGDDGCVTLATIPGYSPGESVVDDAIDNLGRRQLVPSTAAITDVVRCIIAEGVGQGIPGPRGPKGDAGVGVTAVEEGEVVGPGGTPALHFDPETGVLTMDLLQGPPGPGIDAVTATWPEDWHADDPSNATLSTDAAGKVTLALKLPGAGSATTGARINALSWRHGSATTLDGLFSLLTETGLVIGFDQEVQVKTADRFSFLLWLRGASSPDFPLLQEQLVDVTADEIQAFEIEDVDTSDADHPLITKAQPVDGADAAKAIGIKLTPDAGKRLIGGLQDAPRLNSIGVRLLADFVLDRDGHAVDGNHVGGRLPTGNGVHGDTFESWLVFEAGD